MLLHLTNRLKQLISSRACWLLFGLLTLITSSAIGNDDFDSGDDEGWSRVLLLKDYNTRVVILGTSLLGLAAGVVGSFTLLRRRALMGDALSHATLPGIGLAFITATYWGYDAKSLWILLLGGAISGSLGMAVILWMRHSTRLKEDAAMGIVLSVFFGGGMGVLGIVQQMSTGHAAGLEAFIYGKTASMLPSDTMMIGAVGFLGFLICGLLYKEFTLLCFDQGYAASRGYPLVLLDSILMLVVVAITMIGLQAVGLILMIALLTTPAAAARCWTHRLTTMMWLSGTFGLASAALGAATSAVYPRLPSGAMIVLVAATIFIISLLIGKRRGLLFNAIRMWQLNSRIHRDHLLRGVYELLEAQNAPPPTEKGSTAPVAIDALLDIRGWSLGRIRHELSSAERAGLVWCEKDQVRLTASGYRLAAKLVREHRLWEMYLITHADLAPAQVDRTADAIEHVLTPEMIAQLEAMLAREGNTVAIPSSPHPLDAQRADAARKSKTKTGTSSIDPASGGARP